MKIFTIGFTKKSAETFFTQLKNSGATRLIDIRLNNLSQLAGFTKRDDLRYLTRAVCGIDYVHRLDLAPTQALRDAYRTSADWPAYAASFRRLIQTRQIETVPRELIDGACLLCSEEKPDYCHRRLVAEYFREKWGDVQIEHLAPQESQK